MKRALTLKKIQYRRLMKYATYFFIGFLIFDIIFMITNNFDSNPSGISTQPFIQNVVKDIRVALVFLIITIPLSDGTDGFDSSLRFGISRNYYSIINFCSYLIIAIFSKFMEVLSQIPYQTSLNQWLSEALNSLTFKSYLIELISLVLISLLALLYYRFGWKIILVIIGCYIIGSFSIGFLFGHFNGLPTLITHIMQFINQHFIILTLIAIAILSFVQYQCMQRFEIQS